MIPSDVKATLSFSDGSPSMDLPIYKGSIGPDVIDIRKLYAQTGKFTYDPGFLSTAACQSKITYIDGDKGVLLYRGYPIEQLAVHCDFLEVCYLLLNGELPKKAEKEKFDWTVTRHTMVHEQLARLFQGFRRDSHPMAVMVGVVGALSAFYHDSLDINNPEHREISAFRLIAKLPTIVAMAYKYNMGQPFMYPRNELSYTANFMRMMFGVPAEEYEPNEVLVRAMDRIFILHADHEQNASTSFGRQPVRVHRVGHRVPVGARARRRQRGRAADADRPAEGRRRREGRRIREEGEGQELGREADGLRPPRLQELRSAREADAGDHARGAGGGGRRERSLAAARDGAREDRARGRVLRLPQALPQRGLLLGHRAARARHPDLDVHLHLRAGPHRGLDRAME